MKIVIVLPGYAPNPIGGYRVVYSYANELSRLGHAVDIVQAWPERRVWSLANLKNLRWLTGGRRRRPLWFPLRPEVGVSNRWRLSEGILPQGDVYIATSVETADVVAASGPGVYLVQHFETWSNSEASVIESWRLPLIKLMIAPWLVEVAARHDIPSVLLANPIDSDEFPSGGPISQRSELVGTMLSPMAFKRNDIAFAVFERVKHFRPEVRGVAFGVGTRPRDLPQWVDYEQKPSRARLSELYRSLQVFFCSSDSEGWYLPGTEALSSGTLLVSTENGGVRAYAAGLAGFAPTGDVDRLADLVIERLRAPGQFNAVAAEGASAVRRWDLTAAARRLEGLLKDASEK